jgi:hypothetical protein
MFFGFVSSTILSKSSKSKLLLFSMAPIFSTIVSETLRAMNVAPDSAVKNMVMRDESIKSGAAAPIQRVVLTQ